MTNTTQTKRTGIDRFLATCTMPRNLVATGMGGFIAQMLIYGRDFFTAVGIGTTIAVSVGLLASGILWINDRHDSK